jgi:pimeloyl-ACP methyl ester carboxylesterase
MKLLAKCYDMWLQPAVIEPADLKKISIPLLVMAGDHDFTSVDENAELFRDVAPHHHAAGWGAAGVALSRRAARPSLRSQGLRP